MLPIDEAVDGHLPVRKSWDGQWESVSPLALLTEYTGPKISVSEAKAQNKKIQKENAKAERENEVRRLDSRECGFELSPTNISVPIAIIDEWIAAAKIRKSVTAAIYLHPDVQRETRV